MGLEKKYLVISEEESNNKYYCLFYWGTDRMYDIRVTLPRPVPDGIRKGSHMVIEWRSLPDKTLRSVEGDVYWRRRNIVKMIGKELVIGETDADKP